MEKRLSLSMFLLASLFLLPASARADPWLFKPTLNYGAIACQTQNGAAYLARVIKSLHLHDWHEVKNTVPKQQWASFMIGEGCITVPPHTYWQELGSDNTVAYMRLYPWSADRLVVMWFLRGEISDKAGNLPRQSKQF